MKVYLFITNQAFDGLCDNETKVCTYAKKEDAESAFNKFIQEERKLANEYGWTIEEDDNSFSCYEEGYYLVKHSDAWIEESELK